jgi:hypothetical protein
VSRLPNYGVNKFLIGVKGAFGKKLSYDNSGKRIIDILEVMGHADDTEADASTPDKGYYGTVDLYSKDEYAFESNILNQDADGNPDYINRWDVAPDFTMKTFVKEIVYFCELEAQRTVTTIYVSNYPIIKNFTNQDFYVVNKKGDRDYSKKILLSFNDYLEEIDRIGNLAKSDITVQVVNENGETCLLDIGQKIVAEYWFYTHTDNLRDNDNNTYWTTVDNNVDSYIEIDFNPSGAKSNLVYNNIEFVFRNIAYGVGPYEYIIQGADLLANNRKRFKTLASGVLPAKDEGASYVVTFDDVDYRFLKIVLIGTVNDDYVYCQSLLSNSNAAIEGKALSGPTVNLDLHYSGNIQIDSNETYHLNIMDYNLLSDIQHLPYSGVAGIINFLYHKNYLDNNLPSHSVSILSGDYFPESGDFNFSVTNTPDFNLALSGNSVGIDFGEMRSCDFAGLRDATSYNGIIYDNSFSVWVSNDNVTYVPASDAIVDNVYTNCLGIDIAIRDIDSYCRYLKVNYIGYSGADVINNSDLMLTPFPEYMRVSNIHFTNPYAINLTSPISGSGSYIGIDYDSYGFEHLLFNIPASNNLTTFYETSGSFFDPKTVFDIEPYTNILDMHDYLLANVIPYYASPLDYNGTLTKGEQISVSDINSKNIAEFFIPISYNGNDSDKSAYQLVYYNLRYGTDILYQGIPAANLFFDADYFGGIINSGSSDSPTPGNKIVNNSYLKYLLLTKDILNDTITNNGDIFYVQFSEICNYRLYAVNIETEVRSILTENTDYTINVKNKKVIITSDFVDRYENHYVEAEYEYPIFKNDYLYTSPSIYFNILESRNEEKKIQLADLKIVPREYFCEYEVNDWSQVMRFTNNPATWEEKFSTSASLVDLLDGSVKKDHLSVKSRGTFTMTAQKADVNFRDRLLEWDQEKEVLRLVDDLKRYYDGYLVPDSFSTTRRKTSKLEQEQETSSYTYSFSFREK